ncbi:MAG: enoyl-CoA hydratase [Candidatus Wenzhouxiangella sp. M2_3B_020]
MQPEPQAEPDEILLQERIDDGILRLTLNDVGRRNALSGTMLATLKTALEQARDDDSIRVIVLAANGPAFCAGHDLKEIKAARVEEDGGRSFFAELMKNCAEVMQLIVNHPRPVISEVAGMATAAGCQLVASCDLAYAAPGARFATPGVHIGLFCSTPMVALSRNVENKFAMEMLLTGDPLDADRAAAIGLVNRVVSDGDLTEFTTGIARKIAAKSGMTVKTGKKAFYRQREMSLAEAYEYASNVMVENLLERDAAEGIDAFIEKRSPRWSQK